MNEEDRDDIDVESMTEDEVREYLARLTPEQFWAAFWKLYSTRED